ncbi:MAG: hypothetical protein C1943_18810 [Halochromatium sp.]|nr:hypothetical protein [Halochromatium sp.]
MHLFTEQGVIDDLGDEQIGAARQVLTETHLTGVLGDESVSAAGVLGSLVLIMDLLFQPNRRGSPTPAPGCSRKSLVMVPRSDHRPR